MPIIPEEELRDLLNAKHDQYNNPDFILKDPIRIPHRFSVKEDVEIAAFLTATIAWGNRLSIVKSAGGLMDRMGGEPFEFIMNATESDISRLDGFVHRTFNSSDLNGFVAALRCVYLQHGGLEKVFTDGFQNGGAFGALSRFRDLFIASGIAPRSRKHVSDVNKGSAAKRLNLFLMWMVRNDRNGVHFGLWKGIPASGLMIPLDTHVGRVARLLGLLQRKSSDWQAVEELTAALRKMDPEDPCKYDFALFGLGLFDHF
jgi:uncharacterized protein (TIGR02757 family)